MLPFVFLACQHHPITPKEASREYENDGRCDGHPTKEGVTDTLSIDLSFRITPHERYPDDSISRSCG